MKFEDMINKIINGDCYELIKNIPNNSIDCIYVDVPYLYNNGGAGNCDIAKSSTKLKMELMGLGNLYDKKLKPSENLRIAMNQKNAKKQLQDISKGFDYKEFIKEAFRIMKICNMFIWCSPMQLLDLMNEIKKYTNSTPTILVWCKTNAIPTTNNIWLSDIEYCIYVRDSGIRLNDGYELKSKWYVSPINQRDKSLYNHPTIKPLELVKRHIQHTTNEGGVILDAFCGSGTTCVACKETNRKYIGMEIDKTYYQYAIDRINNLSQKDRQILDSGQLSLFD